ncbi:MAG: RluA family pseudouridine synthase [Myxococcales bacterium]|nr:RluA family pseudouridine synthase [Polyangiaceae bacterium]MDW8248742.1 RluA family pseudouridine synthase [Myxococcales bacterium]
MEPLFPSPDTLPLALLHEDADLLAVYKPEGLSSIPERDITVPCLQRLLEARRGERLWVVHRLDKEVSGVLLFARNAAAHRALSLAFERREVEKFYTLLVHGSLVQREGEINLPIAQFGSGRMGVDERRGKPSLTRYTSLERPGGFTLVEAKPLTGRRHQLRVHFYSLGHPIVGDLRYGDRAKQATFPRLMLHARRLIVPHPTGSHLDLEVPTPSLFARLLEQRMSPLSQITWFLAYLCYDPRSCVLRACLVPTRFFPSSWPLLSS